jgi:hypothetical protein
LHQDETRSNLRSQLISNVTLSITELDVDDSILGNIYGAFPEPLERISFVDSRRHINRNHIKIFHCQLYLFLMRPYLLFCQFALLYSFNVSAQFTLKTQGFFISAGTDISIGGLTLRPSDNFNIQNRTLTISTDVIPGSPPSITRVYTFDAPITFEGRLGLFYQTPELNGNTETTLQVAFKDATPVTTTSSMVNSTLHYIYVDLITPATFSAVTAAQPGALPVTLVEFTVKKEGQTASLNWSTAYESNSDHFNVEHSTNGIVWNTLSEIPAAKQNTDLKNYGFSHDSPAAGPNYYRLKMVDQDQSYAYSKIRVLSFEQPYSLAIFPNPATEKIRINLDHWENVAAVKLLNQQGTVLLTFNKKTLSKQINMEDIPTGLYVVQLQWDDGSIAAVKVIKQ